MADMPQAAKTDIFVMRNSLISFAWQVPDYDLSGTTWIGTCQIRQQITDTTVADTLAVTVSGQIVSVEVPAAKSLAWAFSQAEYGVQITDSANAARTFRVAQGTLYTDLAVVR